MKIYLEQNVYDAALDRIRRVYSEFPVVVVNWSGGKDSVVLLQMTLIVAEELGRLPLPVMWLDQEAEWQSVVDFSRDMFADPRVDPYWLQMPIRISNATSAESGYQYCWKEGEEWLRDKEPGSYKENITGSDLFAQTLSAFPTAFFPGVRVAQLAGVRAEESPARLNGLTSYATYKDITWGNSKTKDTANFVFYPLYDWDFRDVWKSIHDNGWPYCSLYDAMYQWGVPVRNMRVSNVHHATAINSLTMMQEIEPETWDAVVNRVSGVNAVAHVREAYRSPREVPWMFTGWEQYRDYLLDHLITDDAHKAMFRLHFHGDDKNYKEEAHESLHRMQIAAILTNDYKGVKRKGYHAANGRFSKNKGRRHGRLAINTA